MKRIVIALTAVVLACGVSYGQEPGPNFKHLKPLGRTIGTWQYEGPLLEDVNGMAKKGTDYVTQISWRWILEKNAVEVRWSAEYEGGKKISGKGLFGWDAAEQRIAYGGMNSIGAMSLGTLEFGENGTTSTLTAEGIDGDGEATSFEGVVTKTSKDTLTWQAKARTGGIAEGPSPVYSFKRIKRAKRPQSDKQANEPGPSFDELKRYGPMIGKWRYEGPVLEDLSDLAKKGSKLVFQFSWRRILNKNVVEENWSCEFEGGKKISGKALIGWNAADREIVYGGMDSLGGMGLGTVVFDRVAKTSTLTSEGTAGDGAATSFKGMVTKTGKDTLTWQALHRSGGIIEGPSPVFSFKRVKRAKKAK